MSRKGDKDFSAASCFGFQSHGPLLVQGLHLTDAFREPFPFADYSSLRLLKISYKIIRTNICMIIIISHNFFLSSNLLRDLRQDLAQASLLI